nr:reverse transcriptase domain-containing protein [Tanacetum cinerariifolium]
MQTRSSSKLSRDQTSNPTSSTNTTTKSQAIVVPLILAEQFELKHSLINMMTSEQFLGLEKDNPHDHIRAARRWLEKEPPRSITTWDDLVSKFINEFFPPSRTTNLYNEISNFHQKFDESFHEAWERYKDLLRACPHHGFTELHQLETFYNALNPADQDSLNAAAGGNLLEKNQDSLNAAAGGNLLEKSPQDALTIIENKSKVRNSRSKPIASPVNACDINSSFEIAKLTHAVNQQTSVVTTAMTAMLKQLQATPPPALVKAVEEICVTCGAAGNYNQGNPGYRPQGVADQMRPPEKLQELANTPLNENCSAVILKKLPEKLGDPGKFLIPCGFSELKCKALADLGASINLMPLSVWKELGLPDLIPTRMTLELANRAICTPYGIARDVFVSVGKFTFPADFVVVDYESDPRVPLILGRPFLRTARALIDVHGEEMILCGGNERLNLNMKHDTASYSNNPNRESVNLINIFNVSSEDFLKFDIESDLKEIEFLLYQGKDSNLKDSIDRMDLANLDDYFVDPTPEMFTDEHAPDYSSPPIFNVYDDDYLEVESDADNVYDDPFDSKGEKIKESKLLIDELDLPCDSLPYSEYDSFDSHDFSEVVALPSTDNEDKVFNPRILIHKKPVKIITRVVLDKKLARSSASLVFEDFDHSFCVPLVFKDVPKSKMLLPFSSENEEKVFKPGIYTSEKVHSCFLPKLSHPGYHVFKVNQIFISLMKIFLVQCGKSTPLLDVLLFYFYPP